MHYYTTKACRANVAKIKPVGDGSEMKAQLPSVQEKFARAFIDLQKELSEAAYDNSSLSNNAFDSLTSLTEMRNKPKKARPSRKHETDPLAILTEMGKPKMRRRKESDPLAILSEIEKPKRKKIRGEATRAAPFNRDRSEECSGGGFMRENVLPKKILLRGRLQKRLISESAVAAELEAKKGLSTSNRKFQEKNPYVDDESVSRQIMSNWAAIEDEMKRSSTCSCGSKDVQSNCNITGRNDATKGEIWGNKDRAEVVARCTCMRCGKTWNE